MRRVRRTGAVVWLTAMACTIVTPQDRRSPQSEIEKRDATRKIAVTRVREITATIIDMRDGTAIPGPLAAIANLVWDDDRSFARQLFSKALDLCASADPKDAWGQYRQVFTHLGKRDPAWVASTIAGLKASLRSQLASSTAFDLLEVDPAAALQVTEDAFGADDVISMTSFLRGLRQRDAASADAAYLRILDRLLTRPQVDVLTLTGAGTYIFVHHPHPPFSNDGTLRTIIGGVDIYDIRKDRDGVPRALVRAYLSTASQILLRPSQRVGSASELYVVGHILRAKADIHTPDLIPRFNEAMLAVASSARPDLPGLPTHSLLQQPDRSREAQSTLDSWERSDPNDLRGWRLLVAHQHLIKGEFTEARALGNRISDQTVRSRFLTIATFYEAETWLQGGGPVSRVELVAAKLSPGVESALLWLGIARFYAKSKESDAANDAVHSALRSAEGADEAQQPYLYLAAAACEASALDPSYAAGNAREAVRRFNRLSTAQIARSSWSVTLGTPPIARTFELHVTQVVTDATRNWRTMASRDFEGTLLTVGAIESERFRANCLVALVDYLLNGSERARDT